MGTVSRSRENAYDAAMRLLAHAESIANANTLPDVALGCAAIYAQLAAIPRRRVPRVGKLTPTQEWLYGDQESDPE